MSGAEDIDLKVQRLDVRDGDTVVLTSARPLSRDQTDHIARMWNDRFRPRLGDVSVLVLDGGVDLKVMRKIEPMQAVPDQDDPDNTVWINGRRYVAA